ncbi:V-ATPase subunit C family protein [Aphelenchoides avenae]|nr:V-ATPase subunit C family protein [Aphelenchus avenae]
MVPLNNSTSATGFCGSAFNETTYEHSINLVISPDSVILTEDAFTLSVVCVRQPEDIMLTLVAPSMDPAIRIMRTESLTVLGDGGSAPSLTLRILGGHGITGANLSEALVGQRLTMDVELKDTSIYDVLVHNCVAHDGTMGTETTLNIVDSKGCAVRLPRAVDAPILVNTPYKNAAKHVYAHMYGFHFSSSNFVHFECQVTVCIYDCKRKQCDESEAPVDTAMSNMGPFTVKTVLQVFPQQVTPTKAMSASTNEIWIISAPGEKTPQETWERLQAATSQLATNSKFNIPDLKVGTLDQLVGLSDDLSKLDSAAEQTTRKLVQYFAEVLEEERDKLVDNLTIGNKDMHTYITKFQWEGAKYPLKQSLKVLSEIIGKQITQIDNDLKAKALAYNNLKNSLASIDRKATGSLVTKDLGDLVKAEDFVDGSEYLQTVVVVVPRMQIREWEAKYTSFASMVVPGSARKITEDQEHALYTVTLFKKVVEEYRNNCRENKFIVRDFVYDENTLKAGKNERDKLVQEKQRQYAPLVRWLKINFGEIFSAYVHIKALRVFVESVLRFGLPVNFQAAIIEPNKGNSKKLRSELGKLYQHLDGTASGPIETFDDAPTLVSLGVHDYYPYVFFKMSIDFFEKR